MQLAHVFVLILAVSAAGQTYTISTVAGGGLPSTPVAATSAQIQPVSATVDAAGNVYFSSGNAVFKLDAAGTLTRVVGAPGGGPVGDGGPATSAQMYRPAGLAMDSTGNLYIAESINHRIRKVAPGGTISTVAGNGTAGYSGDGGPATSAQLNGPYGVAVDSAGNLYIADRFNLRIRKVAPGGTISTVAGNGNIGYSGDGSPAIGAQLNNPYGVAVDSAGNLYIADTVNQRIRKVAPGGTISTVAGSGTYGYSGDGGPATSAQLSNPFGLAVDSAGNLYIADKSNQRIRKVTPGGTISTVAGGGSFGSLGDGGPATSAWLGSPNGVAVDATGNLYVADPFDNRIRKVASSGTISTVAGNGTFGYSGDGGPATGAQLNSPYGVAVDSTGNLYVADTSNSRVRKVAPGGAISTVAGNGVAGYSGDGGPATGAQLNNPYSVAIDSAGNLYIADNANQRIRKVAPGGMISTVAGNGSYGSSGDGGLATNAQISEPKGVAVDSAGNLYIADTNNHRIRKVAPGGTITTVAGTGTGGYSGDGGPAANAQLYSPYSVTADSAGNLYIADTPNNRIRKVTAGGIISTIAGNGSNGYSGDGGPATSAQLTYPSGVGADAAGNLYIADLGNQRIRMVAPDGTITTVAGNGTPGYSGDGGPATSAQLHGPASVAVDAAGRIHVADSGSYSIRVLTPAGSACTYSATPGSLQAPVSGGNLTVTIQTTASCSWTVSGLPGWITVSGAASGAGSATVTLIAATNTGAARNATLLIAGVSITVAQQGAGGCNYAISPGSQVFPMAGGAGTITITATPGCPWSVLNPLNWVTIAGANAGTGSGALTYQVAANSGVSRSGILSIAGLSFTIEQAGVPVVNFSIAGSMAQLASAGYWKTTMTLINTGAVAAQIRLNFFDDNGNPLVLPLSFPQSSGAGSPLSTSTLDRTVSAGAALVIESTGPDTSPPLVGWAQLLSSGNVGAFAVFQQKVGNIQQEAVVLLENRNAASYVLYFDNTSGFATGVALANTTTQSASVTVVIRDDTGADTLSHTITLPPRGHTSFNLVDRYVVTARKRGTIEFQTQAAGQISVLGLRFNPTLAFSTIPAVAK